LFIKTKFTDAIAVVNTTFVLVSLLIQENKRGSQFHFPAAAREHTATESYWEEGHCTSWHQPPHQARRVDLPGGGESRRNSC
jgi:hypothetical protein